jgi:hypothetical protein
MEVKQSTRKQDFYLITLDLISKGLYPAQICEKLGISKQRLNHYIKTLKAQGRITKLSTGAWELSKSFNPQEVKVSTRVGKSSAPPQDSVRGHGFVIKFDIPKDLANWKERSKLLSEIKGLQAEPLNIFGGGQKLIYKKHKVWLTDKSIIIYGKPGESYFAPNSTISQEQALTYFLGLLNGLQGLLKANWGNLKFKVSRQHYALVKNALANQYDKEGKKLEVYTDKGLWLLIDNSFNLNELETVHPKTAVDDNKKVQDFFNGIKQFEGFTPKFLVDSIGQVTQNQEMFAKNIESHIGAIKALAVGVDELTKVVKELKK